jgi:hypothetical protein
MGQRQSNIDELVGKTVHSFIAHKGHMHFYSSMVDNISNIDATLELKTAEDKIYTFYYRWITPYLLKNGKPIHDNIEPFIIKSISHDETVLYDVCLSWCDTSNVKHSYQIRDFYDNIFEIDNVKYIRKN